jgi:hypothetical protein
LVIGLTALFLVAVCLPAAAYDGQVRNRIDIGGDEHPWGGENRGQDEDVIGLRTTTSIDDPRNPDPTTVEIVWDSFWQSLREYFFFSLAISQSNQVDKDKATPAPLPQPEPPQNSDSGTGIR